MLNIIVLIVLTIVATQPAHADRLDRIIDGDTFVVAGGQRVRIWGIDTPERGKPCFNEATEQLRQVLVGQEFSLDCVGKSYNRDVCRVKLSDGRDVGRLMVLSGYARDVRRYSHGYYLDDQRAAPKPNCFK